MNPLTRILVWLLVLIVILALVFKLGGKSGLQSTLLFAGILLFSELILRAGPSILLD